MRRVQAAALELFEARGFDAVSIEEVARAAEVGAATVYRNFATKERLVLWDEYDPPLLAALAERLTSAEPLAAMQAALEATLARLHAREAERILRRARLVRATPALTRASSADQAALAAAIAAVLDASGKTRDALASQVVAAVLVAVLVAALDHWLAQEGRLPLARCLRMAFARLP